MAISFTDPGVSSALALPQAELNYVAGCCVTGVRAAYGKDQVFFVGSKKGLKGGMIPLPRPLTATDADLKTIEEAMDGVDLDDLTPIEPGRELKEKGIVAVIGKEIEEWIKTAVVDGKKIFMIWSPKRTSFCLVLRSDPGSKVIPVAFPTFAPTP